MAGIFLFFFFFSLTFWCVFTTRSGRQSVLHTAAPRCHRFINDFQVCGLLIECEMFPTAGLINLVKKNCRLPRQKRTVEIFLKKIFFSFFVNTLPSVCVHQRRWKNEQSVDMSATTSRIVKCRNFRREKKCGRHFASDVSCFCLGTIC